MSKKVGSDFDGVIHEYSTPWVAPHKIPDPPVSGAIEWLNNLADQGVEVFIFTTRAQTLEGIYAVREWLKKWGYKRSESVVVTTQKLAADLYIDDRGYRFTGSNFPTLEEIKSLERWGRKGGDRPFLSDLSNASVTTKTN